MEKEGRSFKEIFQSTGWFCEMDNGWRYEIDDYERDIYGGNADKGYG